MTYTSLDEIIKGFLLQKGYSIHFYIDCLIYAKRCFEELHFDCLGNVNAEKITIDDDGRAELPDDYLDMIKIGIPDGQFIRPMTRRTGYSALPPEQVSTPGQYFNGLFWIGNYYNDYNEHIGRFYGARSHGTETFKILPADGEVQFDLNLGVSEVVIEYISDGTHIDNATKIIPYAKSTFEAYIDWKLKENSRAYSDGQAMLAMRKFEHERGILRGRLNPLTIQDIKAIINRNAGSGKSG